MLHNNPLQVSCLFAYEPGDSVYARAETLMSMHNGFIGQPWSCLREAWFSKATSRLIVIDYKTLASDSDKVMGQLYMAMDEKPFRHDYNDVSYDEPAYDADLGMPGIHTVGRRVVFKERAPCIPPSWRSTQT